MRRPRLPGSRYWLSYLYAGIGAVLLLGSFLTLWPMRHTEGFGSELRINIGANLFDLVLAVLVLQPLVLSLNRNAVRWRNRLDYREVIRRIRASDDRVDIWKHWTGLLEPSYLDDFTAAVRSALDRGVHFRIMLTDPSCPDAAERARQVAPTDAVALMRLNLERLDAFRHALPERDRERFQVRISQIGPAHAFYRVDDWLSYGLFRDRRMSENHQREVRVRGDVGGLALEAFTTRWGAAGLLGLADHFRMRLPVLNGAPALRYVTHEGEHWVDLDTADLPAEVTAATLADVSAETRKGVLALWSAKYGPGRHAVLVRVTGVS
ncbi:hypothetical protein JIG36_28945 [Actinoplanes sp. LDG1-06]|uniref:Uncharacterized protein n=1 Tax=Paractinoplanes ovalisporus TaxID=2810368 RepID=A0ABS2AIF8_9ACTN|nr:hypothetical protein [Actinoplanes ovalisporus]MBM2619578.1 hypothetical protein [Actinoplanes ovalisporus]